MSARKWSHRFAIILLTAAAVGHMARAQSPTSAAISGRVLDAQGRGVQGADVLVSNRSTGSAMRSTSRADGRYLVSGLEVGGPYSVTVRRLGSPMQTRNELFLTLGQELRVDITLEQPMVMLQSVETRAAQERMFSRSHMGAETFLSDSLIHQMPVINRDLYDLVRLAPQMSTWFALAPSGAGTRLNNIQIDGISDQVPSSNLAAGQLYGGKVIPLDAVKEYQVLFSPYDVRQGSFAGANVNVVTRSGSNALHGSVFGYGTNEHLGPNVPLVRNTRYEKEQFGLSLGGPIIPDHLLFFLSSEVQRRVIPAMGASLDASGESVLPVHSADIARFQRLLSSDGLDPGTAGPVTNANPSSSTFLRLDAPIARWNSRVTVRGSYGHADSAIFARPTMLAPTNCPTSACFPLSSLQHSRWLDKEFLAAELNTNFASGAYNELLAGFGHTVTGFRPTIKQPLILVSVPGTGGAPALLQAGTHEIATGQKNSTRTLELTDNFSISAGSHRLTLGVSLQLFDLWAFQERGAYGVWEFASLDSLQAGTASRYRVTRDTGSVTAASGAYRAFYVGDVWDASPRLSLSFGLRADQSVLSAKPPYVAAVDSTFHLRTDKVPSGAVQWSPRLGFNYHLTSDDAGTQLRGGVGLFTGRAPLFWLFGGFAAYGLAARTLQCGTLPGDSGPAPSFRADFSSPPMACSGGQTFAGATAGEVDVIDSHLRLPQTMRASLAADAELPFGVVGTIEGLYTHATHAVIFLPLNLREPVSRDAHDRLMYGTVTAPGVAVPSRVSAQLGDVVAVMNESRDHAYDVTGELGKHSRFVDASASLSYGRARDVASPRPVSALLTDNWRFARPVVGRENELGLGISDFDQPFRVRASGTLHSPWRALQTDLTFSYVGGSGFPYTYVAGGAQGRGDLNADGVTGNDPIYIPRNALDTAAIKFAGTAAEVATQRDAFEHFVDGASCLRSHRGEIMRRNSCRSPWMSLTNLAIRQMLPLIGQQELACELQVFNVLNLLNFHWGRMQLPTGATLSTTSQIPLLSQVGESGGPQPQPIYRFDSTMRRYNDQNFDTYYQIQLAIRYAF